MMFCQLAGKDTDDDTFGAGKLSFKDTDGALLYGDWGLNIGGAIYNQGVGHTSTIHSVDGTVYYGLRADVDDDTYGIQIGSGTNAESFEDYVLQTRIDSGILAGQISYQASEDNSITYTAGTGVLENSLARYFNNNSGGSINVNEVDLVANTYSATKILMVRDHLISTSTVPDTGQLKAVYTISLTYPA